MREHGLLTVPGVRNLEKENELWVTEEGGETLKTEELEITRSNKSAGGQLDRNEKGHIAEVRLRGKKTKPSGSKWGAVGPNEQRVQGNEIRGYLVSRSTNTPVTRG